VEPTKVEGHMTKHRWNGIQMDDHVVERVECLDAKVEVTRCQVKRGSHGECFVEGLLTREVYASGIGEWVPRDHLIGFNSHLTI